MWVIDSNLLADTNFLLSKQLQPEYEMESERA